MITICCHIDNSNAKNILYYYRNQLDKAYKLCSPCKKVLQMKLHKEKETLLGSKLLEMRTPEKNKNRTEKRNKLIKTTINTTSRLIAAILIVLVAIECYENASKHKNLSSTVNNVKIIFYSLIDRIISIVKMKTLLTFPSLANQLIELNNSIDIDIFTSFNSVLNDLTQKALGSFVCFIQIIGHFWNINKTKYSIFIDLLWSIFVVTSIGHVYLSTDPIIMSLIKVSKMSIEETKIFFIKVQKIIICRITCFSYRVHWQCLLFIEA